MLAVAVLAAGKGTRMKSALPKVLQPLAGATLVERVLASARTLAPERRILIVGHQADRVEEQPQTPRTRQAPDVAGHIASRPPRMP